RTFSPVRRPLEALLQQLLRTSPGAACAALPHSPSPRESARLSLDVLQRLGLDPQDRRGGDAPLLRDWWTGELRSPASASRNDMPAEGEPQASSEPPRSSHLLRRPEVREAKEGEDDDRDPGILMVQLDEPHQQAEDPLGLNRPVDRDEDISADEYGDMLSELSQARLVSTPGSSKEVLISDDPPDTNTAMQLKTAIREVGGLQYPEWDCRTQAYSQPGATLRVPPNLPGYTHQALLMSPYTLRTIDDRVARSLLPRLHQVRDCGFLSERRYSQRRYLGGDCCCQETDSSTYADYGACSSLPSALKLTRRT